MAALDENQAHDLLFGDTDPREVALFLAQQGLTMDAQERDQRLTVLRVLNIQATREMAVQTGRLAEETKEVARWTRAMAIVAFLAVIVAVGVALMNRT